MPTPSFSEDRISQLPALKLLINLGWEYLTPEEALQARGGRTSQVLLENILREQLGKINRIEYRQKEFEFSEQNMVSAVLALRDLPLQDGYLAANRAYYELVTLGKSFEQSVMGDKKSFSFRYVDWKNPANNSYHVTEEFSVLRSGRNDHYRPDLVLFVNGIPMVVVECKPPHLKNPVEKAIEQHLRNQQDDGIRGLYQYSNLLLALATNEAKYATTATGKEFWGFWKEMDFANGGNDGWEAEVARAKNTPLGAETWGRLVGYHEKRGDYLAPLLNGLPAQVTEQDRLLFSLCRPERLLDFVYNYILFDEGAKKVARYQQYFAIKRTLGRLEKTGPHGRRNGGVIWHTQGSGKSLTMVMLAQLIAAHPAIKNPKIVLVTDRIDLDDQITETFKKCHVPVENAVTGSSKLAVKQTLGGEMDREELEKLKDDKSLLGLLARDGDTVVTTLVHKFEALVKADVPPLLSPEIFVLVDEGHRSQYGSLHVKMQKVFPNACFIAFTGTPLMKKEKSTAQKFGGLIDVYSITDAVADGAVVPLLYEGRHNLIEVNERPLDTYFEKVSEPLTDYGKAALKRKYSSKNMLNKADQVVYARAWDISEHFENHVQEVEFGNRRAKGQLVAPNKETAIRYKEYFDEIGRVRAEVVISPPDTREGEEDAFLKSGDRVKEFWQAKMAQYGTQEKYEKAVINDFKKQDTPEIIIVVDKLLTGFDAPNNYVLYITRPLKEHTLLQAIARVNRLAPGKEHGLVIDYYGNLENMDKAIKAYSGDGPFEAEDLAGTWTNLAEEVGKLPQAHSELWDIFRPVSNKYDEAAYEELLADEALRHRFYEKVSVFSRILKLALSSLEFLSNTPEKQVGKYKSDAKFFLALRVSVKRRFFDIPDYEAYEPQVQKLIDKHITTDGEVLKLTELVDIFDRDQREAEVEKLSSKAAKADHIASRTIRALNVKMNEDPVFYKRLSQLIRETINDYHQQRIDEAEFLKRAKEYESTFFNGQRDGVPPALQGNPHAIALYNLVTDTFAGLAASHPSLPVEIAATVDELVRGIVHEDGRLVIDWQNKADIEGRIKIEIDDYFFGLQAKYGVGFDLALVDVFVEEGLKVSKLKFV